MASAPDITFRNNVSPNGVLAAAVFVQSTLGGNNLPVLQVVSPAPGSIPWQPRKSK